MPEHEVPEHEVPEHEVPEHEVAGHEVAGHEVAGHEVAGHEVAGHEVAGHEVAGHEGAEPGPVPGGRGLLLDIGGVVVDTGLQLVARLAEREPAIRPLLDRIGGLGTERDELWQRVLRREVTDRAYWAQRAAEVGAALGETWDTRTMMERLYALPREEWLRADVVRLMADTSAAGLPLGALTNDMGDFHGPDWVARQDYLKLFDVIVDASLTGVRKPDPRAFLAAAEALRRPPGQVVYLDDLPWNVAAAAKVGMLAVEVPPDRPGPAVDAARDLLGLRARTP